MKFFELVRDHSMQAYYGSPIHGGNRNKISYKMMKLDYPADHWSKPLQNITMANKHVNAIVVGSGAGGGIVAKELSTAGLSVVLFERGGWISYDDHTDDELISQPSAPLGTSCGPDDETIPKGG